jgi:signal transduction histidine kinase
MQLFNFSDGAENIKEEVSAKKKPEACAFGEKITDPNDTETLSRELKETKADLSANKAAILNLLEDLSTEKQLIEEEVERRTEELKSERSILRSTIDSLPIAYFLISSDLILIDSNSLLSKILSVEKITSFSEMDKILTEGFSLRESCDSVISKNQARVFGEVRFGSKFLKIYLQPVSSIETKERIGLLGMIEDITERKILDRAKDEFFSIASHELRTPLTAIMGNTSMLLDFFKSNSPNRDVEQMVEDIHEASTRLIKIVGDFLDISRLEQGKVVLRPENFDFSILLDEITREFKSAAILKGLQLDTRGIGDNLLAYADRDRTKQIIYNLTNNAINYTKKGGILLYTKKEEPSTISLFVEDSGVGISKDNQELLFRKFQQAQDKILTRDVSSSTGLGLYISKLLADQMNARVDLVKSEAGKGSVFRLILPIGL